MVGDKIGSVWRVWDLHLHAPGTKMSDGYGGFSPETDQRFIDVLEASPVDVFGITDYFSCQRTFEVIDAFRERYPSSHKAFFINVELRLAEAISAEGDSPHLHVIFDGDETACPREKIITFLRTLKTKGADKSRARLSCADLKSPEEFASASVSLHEVVASLNETFGVEKPYLLIFPASNDGIRSTNTRSPRKIIISDEIDRACQAFLGQANSRDYFLKEDRYKDGKSDPKPVIWGSDAHSFGDLERLKGRTPHFPHTWIKADPTFRGLQQIGFEPEGRVFIGDTPPAELRKARHPTKILKRLKINHVPGYRGVKGQWFKDVSIPLNPELTAIIGNKGSCKSAMVDIIALLGESRREADFSFLIDVRGSKKFRQKGYAENFQAEVEWLSGPPVTKLLSASVDQTKPEAVRYLPQHYFERLTNEIQIEDFRRQIEDVVFSHVDETDRMGEGTFKGLLDLMTLQSKNETSALKVKLRALNVEIVEMEGRASPDHITALKAQLIAKQTELDAIVDPPPQEMPDDVQTAEQATLSADAGKLTAELAELQSRQISATAKIADLKRRRTVLGSVTESMSGLARRVNETIEDLGPMLEEFGIKAADVIALTVRAELISALVDQIAVDLKLLEADNAVTFKTWDPDALTSLPNIKAGITQGTAALAELNLQLSAPQREYQRYVEQLQATKQQRASVLGDEDEPQAGTIRYIEREIRRVQDELPAEMAKANLARDRLTRAIYASKNRLLQFYKDLKRSVDAQLTAVAINEFKVEIDASFAIKNGFSDEFLAKVVKNRRGPFNNRDKPPDQILGEFLSPVDWNDVDLILVGIRKILAAMQKDGLRLPEQVREPKEFYDFLFSLDYIEPAYRLRLSGKDLEELSPGEKGLLLLIFYLQLDRDDIPLVIDQPEDNLDNESIFKVLALCIRNAKNSRQVILVTHNPNLAVGADAEQILYVELDKAKNYHFSFESGAIENPGINQRIVRVLEGSQPAFVKRRLKYNI